MLFRLPENWWLWEHAQTTHWPTDDIHAGSVLVSAAAGIGKEDCMWEVTLSWWLQLTLLVCGYL